MYLTLEEKQRVFNNVRELLQVYGGVWITHDLTTKENLSHRWKVTVIKYSLLVVFHQLTCLQPLEIDAAVAKSIIADSSIFALALS